MNKVWEIFKKPPKYVNFEDVQNYIKHRRGGILIVNTMSSNEQNCLIPHTIPFNEEENLINEMLLKGVKQTIILYGKNYADITVDKKFQQLVHLGFSEVYIYRGGMFEWLLLQDIYGISEFPTVGKTLDLLKYRVRGNINI